MHGLCVVDVVGDAVRGVLSEAYRVQVDLMDADTDSWAFSHKGNAGQNQPKVSVCW